MKYIFSFELDYENRRTLAERSIKVKIISEYEILCFTLLLLWWKINQHPPPKKGNSVSPAATAFIFLTKTPSNIT
jgi:hypothetical protein